MIGTALLLAAGGVWQAMSGNGDRVADARRVAVPTMRERFAGVGLAYPPNRVFLRAFKRERQLELWAAPRTGPYKLVATYPIAAMSGKVGPKRREGDLQVPEGFYTIDAFNPQSRYLLSMRVSYPNASDKIRGRPPLGGDIYIHGNEKSIGCLAMTDRLIPEIYLTVLDATNPIRPVHIFPCRMTDANLAEIERERPELAPFWSELRKGYDVFERTRRLPTVRVLADGRYSIGER